MRVLLTGAAGFIGGHVATALAERGHDVVGVDALIPAAHPVGVEPPAGVVRLDVRDADRLDGLLAGVDVVCHQAAMVGNGVDAQDLPAYAAHNDLGTAQLLAAMARAGVDRLVLASSMVVYGDGRYRCARHGDVEPAPRRIEDLDDGVFDHRCPRCSALVEWALVDESAPLRPRSAYAASKVAQEHYAAAWCTLRSGRAVALRYHNVYGPGLPADTPYAGVAAIFRSAAARGEAPQVYEDGRQARDFVHVTDVADANVAAIEAVGDHPEGLTAYNVCSGQPRTVGDLAAAIASAGSGPAPIVSGRYRAADVRHVVASPDAARDGLGFRARVDPDIGLKELATAPLRPTTSP
ncbi:MAG TPA: NAD-dependent epimerase/dehydratase family protein [Nocardioidaceae bacterium]|nr:NAD-dependent epimerase/dehydratase family protein [Nocardioidaceae bacterium]